MISDKEDPDWAEVLRGAVDDERTSHRLKNEQHCFGVPKKPAKTVETLGKVIRPLQGKEIYVLLLLKKKTQKMNKIRNKVLIRIFQFLFQISSNS